MRGAPVRQTTPVCDGGPIVFLKVWPEAPKPELYLCDMYSGCLDMIT